MTPTFCPQLMRCLKHYNAKLFFQDSIAGIIVGIVAIPLAIAFGIASGVGPAEGLITAIVAGFIISAFGGSKVQIGGPTGAFIVIIYGIIQTHGIGGLMIATIMAGVILVLIGAFKLGGIIKFVPYPVIVGFTAGIALTIFSTQMNDFFGMNINKLPADFIHKWGCYFSRLSDINWAAFGVGVAALAIIIFLPKISKKIPASLVAIIFTTLAVWIMKHFGLGTDIKTISELYQLPQGIPTPKIPSLQLAEAQSWWTTVKELFPSAFTIAILGAIESLLSAMVADGVTGDKHDSNTELIAQGMANICTPFFGGIPATGAIARTMTNINNGGKTPVAGIVHTLVLLLVLLFMGKLVGMIPMACLAAVLIMVSYNMSGWRSFVWLSKTHKSDMAVMLITFLLTVIFDLTIAIGVGMLLAIGLFLKRTNEAIMIRSFSGELDPSNNNDVWIDDLKMLHIPENTEVYEIDGPYFFGIANKFDEISRSVGKDGQKVRILRMRKVSFIDSTGIYNLEQLYHRSKSCGVKLVLSGVNNDVLESLKKAGLVEKIGMKNIRKHINGALERAEEIVSGK